MATNSSGHLLDGKGEVAVDFVWGNFPMQPNDVRSENGGGHLDITLDNHNIAYAGWNGYPQYTPNTVGEGAGNVLVPNVLGALTADAYEAMEDVMLAVTTATAATNTAKAITRINVTSTTAATVYATGANTAYAVGTKVAIGAGTGIPAALVGTWVVTGGASGNIVIVGTGWTVADTGAITPTASLTGKAGTISAQSIAAGADNVHVGDAVTITPWA